jgi:cobalt-zinc-cadmium efflux system outer membrane protein
LSPFIRGPYITALLSTTLVVCFANVGFSAPAPAFPDLLRSSLTAAPRLEEGRAGISQAEGLRDQAGARPNPSISAEMENFAPTGPSNGLRGADARQNTYSITQPIELWGKRSARIEAGDAGVTAAQARMEQTQADYAYDLANAYLDAEAAEQKLGIAQATLKLAEDDARVATALVKSGKEAQIRQIQAETARATARAAVEAAHSQVEKAFARLTALTASATPFTTVAVSLLSHADRYEPPAIPDPLQTPAYRAALAARDEVQRRIAVERTRALPDVNVSLGVRTFAGTDAKALVGGLSFPIPIFDTNRGNISAAEAELRAANSRLAAARYDADAEARAAVARARAALSRIAAAIEAEKAAEKAYTLTRSGYEGGKLSFIEVLASSRALADARATTIDARLERLTAEAALARLQGAIPFGDHL